MPYPTPLFDRAGRLVGAVNLLMDITDPKRAQAEAQRMRSLLEDRVEHRTQALSDTADRLNESEQTFQLRSKAATEEEEVAARTQALNGFGDRRLNVYLSEHFDIVGVRHQEISGWRYRA